MKNKFKNITVSSRIVVKSRVCDNPLCENTNSSRFKRMWKIKITNKDTNLFSEYACKTYCLENDKINNKDKYYFCTKCCNTKQDIVDAILDIADIGYNNLKIKI